MSDICIVSGSDRQRLRSHVNHQVFAQLNGFDYHFEHGPIPGLISRFYVKPETVRRALAEHEWVFWVDDDAFFTSFDGSAVLSIVEEAQRNDWSMVFGASPVSRDHPKWSALNSGVILVHRSPAAFAILEKTLATDPDEEPAAWWRPECGYFTHSDQDAFVWVIETGGYSHQVGIIDHLRINARSYEFDQACDEHFIVHFPGVPNKERAIDEFAARFGLDDTLVPFALQRECRLSPHRPLTPRAVQVRHWRRALKRRVRAAVRR